MLGATSSTLLYCFVMIVCVMLAHAVTSSKKIGGKIWLFLIITILSLLAGFRSENVGLDTITYNWHFQMILDGNAKELAVMVRESSYVYISEFLLKIFKTPQALFIIYAFITNGLIIARFYTLRDKASLPVMVFAYISTQYFFTFNIMRQFVTVAIVFYATKFLFNKEYFRYVLCCIVSMSFHITGILGLVILVLYYFIYNYETGQKRKNVWLVVACIPIAIAGGIFLLSKYKDYFTGAVHFDFSPILALKMLILAIYVYREQRYRKWADVSLRAKMDKENLVVENTMPYVYIVGLIATMLGSFINYADRVGIYFMMFEAVFIGYVCKNSSCSSYKVAYLTILLYVFLSTVFSLGGRLQYAVFWS